MNICDLKHLETLNQTPEVVGGSGNFNFDGVQMNDGIVIEYAQSVAYGNSFDGNAIATATSLNDSQLGQVNDALIV